MITLVGEVLFALTRDMLAQKTGQELKRMVSEVKAGDAQEIAVIGHTDDAQTKAHRQKLNRRAEVAVVE